MAAAGTVLDRASQALTAASQYLEKVTSPQSDNLRKLISKGSLETALFFPAALADKASSLATRGVGLLKHIANGPSILGCLVQLATVIAQVVVRMAVFGAVAMPIYLTEVVLAVAAGTVYIIAKLIEKVVKGIFKVLKFIFVTALWDNMLCRAGNAIATKVFVVGCRNKLREHNGDLRAVVDEIAKKAGITRGPLHIDVADHYDVSLVHSPSAGSPSTREALHKSDLHTLDFRTPRLVTTSSSASSTVPPGALAV